MKLTYPLPSMNSHANRFAHCNMCCCRTTARWKWKQSKNGTRTSQISLIVWDQSTRAKSQVPRFLSCLLSHLTEDQMTWRPDDLMVWGMYGTILMRTGLTVVRCIFRDLGFCQDTRLSGRPFSCWCFVAFNLLCGRSSKSSWHNLAGVGVGSHSIPHGVHGSRILLSCTITNFILTQGFDISDIYEEEVMPSYW